MVDRGVKKSRGFPLGHSSGLAPPSQPECLIPASKSVGGVGGASLVWLGQNPPSRTFDPQIIEETTGHGGCNVPSKLNRSKRVAPSQGLTASSRGGILSGWSRNNDRGGPGVRPIDDVLGRLLLLSIHIRT